MTIDSAVLELQVKVAFLEDALSKLSDEHFKQQRDIELLKRQNALLIEKLESTSSNSTESVTEIEKPPHY